MLLVMIGVGHQIAPLEAELKMILRTHLEDAEIPCCFGIKLSQYHAAFALWKCVVQVIQHINNTEYYPSSAGH